jgi:hypothetical protein
VLIPVLLVKAAIPVESQPVHGKGTAWCALNCSY